MVQVTFKPTKSPINSIQVRHVVVGAAGFIGQAIVRRLLFEGFPVVSVGQPAHADILKNTGAKVVLSSVENVDWTSFLCPGDVVHYYAWNSVPGSANNDPAQDLNTNVAPLIRLLEVLRRMENPGILLFTSSGGTVYGKLKDVPVSESHALAPLTAYGAAKATAEFYLNFYRQLYGVDCRIARLANPYGLGQNISKGQGAVSIFIDRIINTKAIHVWGDGETIRDYLHIDDVVCGLLAIARADPVKNSCVFNLGSGHGLSINALIFQLSQLTGRKVEVIYDPARKFDVPVSVLDISRAREELGWHPQVDLSTGLSRMFGYLSDQNDSNRTTRATKISP